MQETLTQSEKYTSSAATKSVERIWFEKRKQGSVSYETVSQIIDEEKTHAAEILALITKRGVIPREYLYENGDLSDAYGFNIGKVLEDGVVDAENKVSNGQKGAEWELQRRQIEKRNFEEHILNLRPGQICLEFSATDFTKPEDERRSYGYNGDTLIRITYRETDTKFSQLNIVIPCSDLKFLSRIQNKLSGTKDKVNSAVELLSDPKVIEMNANSLEQYGSDVETEINMSLLRTRPAMAISRMIKRAKDAWNLLDMHEDIFQELTSELNRISNLPASEWEREANMARAGAWQLLIERAKGKSKGKKQSIRSGIERARAEGASFTGCGGTVDMTSLKSLNQTSFIDRLITSRDLRERFAGLGSCNACNTSGQLYGCGVYCRDCNEIWCDEYAKTGTQLEDKQVKERKYYSFVGRSFSLF